MKTIYHKGTKRSYYMHDIDADNALATGLYQDSPVLEETNEIEEPVETEEKQETEKPKRGRKSKQDKDE